MLLKHRLLVLSREAINFIIIVIRAVSINIIVGRVFAIFVVGASMGGSIRLLWLGTGGERGLLVGIVMA